MKRKTYERKIKEKKGKSKNKNSCYTDLNIDAIYPCILLGRGCCLMDYLTVYLF